MYSIGWCDIEKYYTNHDEVNICSQLYSPIWVQLCVWQYSFQQNLLILEDCYQLQYWVKHYYTNNVRWHIGQYNNDKCWFNNRSTIVIGSILRNIGQTSWCTVLGYVILKNITPKTMKSIFVRNYIPQYWFKCVFDNIHFNKIY
jgi:hypothetical protein